MGKSIKRLSLLVDSVKTYAEFEQKVLDKPRWYLRDNDNNLKRWTKVHLRQFYELIKGKLPLAKINEIL